MGNQIFRIAVCDDERTDRKQIEEMTKEICAEEEILCGISCFAGAGELLNSIRQGEEYDFLLLDVMMPGTDGMELARELRKKKMESSIAFVSCNREMALQGYEVAAARYLGKPLDREKLKECVLFCYGQCQDKGELLFPVDGGIRKVSPKEIYYVEIVGRKNRIWQEKEDWTTKLSMSELEEILGKYGFLRCHQSFLVNCNYIRTFHTSSMELTDGRRVPVSKHRVKEVRQRFFRYMRK